MPSRHPVTPGASGQNPLTLPAVSGIFHGNFDRRAETEATAAETNKRLLRPGAILLANLDINHAIDPTLFRCLQLDVMDNVVGGGDDSREMATLRIDRPTRVNQHSAKVVLHVHPDDGRRIRVFPSGATSPVVLGPGKTAQAHETTTATREFQFELNPAASPFAFHFQVEAVTLPGSPRNPEPRTADDPSSPPALTAVPAPLPTAALPPSPPPPTFEVFLPSAPTTAVIPAPSTTPVFAERLPGEVWVQLLHLDHAGNPLPAAQQGRDVAVYTIAPWLMLSNLQKSEVVYISDIPANPDTVKDVERAMSRIPGVLLVKIPATQMDGEEDPWVQDEFEIGYCWAVHNWMHVTLHCKRTRGLSLYVRDFLPDDDMGLFDDLTEDDGGDPVLTEPLPHDPGEEPFDSINYGGNLELSPPVEAETGPLADGPGGPAVPRQPRAPFGKILLGHTAARSADKYYLRFLETQKIQPVLPLNTSWLDVGHVDEFMCFVPASSGRRFKLVMASTQTATRLFEAMERERSAGKLLTRLHRGKSWTEEYPPSLPRTPDFDDDAAMSVAAVLVGHQTENDVDIHDILVALEGRLKLGCGLEDSDIVRLPVYFDALAFLGTGKTAAFTPDVANLQVIDRHVLVPRPFGARMELADAGAILRNDMTLASATNARLRPFLQHEFWAFQDETAADIADFFADGGVTEADVIRANPGKFSSGAVSAAMTRLVIPEQTVDLFEAFTQIVLEDIGLTVHLVDDWHTYHRGAGEIHCGTNVKRRPPERDAGSGFQFWWDYYAELVR